MFLESFTGKDKVKSVLEKSFDTSTEHENRSRLLENNLNRDKSNKSSVDKPRKGKKMSLIDEKDMIMETSRLIEISKIFFLLYRRSNDNQYKFAYFRF
jgi:hypothetical protein